MNGYELISEPLAAFWDSAAWIGLRFSSEQYLFWTRIQCLLWTGADVYIVFFLIRIANYCRSLLAAPTHQWPYYFLAATLVFVPAVPFAPTGGIIFALELAITVPHFLLILYLLWANVRIFAEFFGSLQPPERG